MPSSEVDLSFGDILENLDASVMLRGNANNGRFGITGDVIYLRTKTPGDTPGPVFSGATVKSTTKAYSVYGEYLLNTPERSELWAAAGIRYWDVDLQLDLEAGTAAARSDSGGDSWIDPILGLRGRAEIGEKTYVAGWAYVGGFGIGSDLTTDVFGGVGYQFTDTTSAILGFRYSSVDREDGEFEYDTEFAGPIAGVSFRF